MILTLKTFFTNFTMGKQLLILLTPLITVLVSIKLALVGLAIIILLDLYTGIKKSLFRKQLKFNPFRKSTWLVINSEGFRRSWVKAAEYGIGVIVTVVLEALFFKGSIVDILDHNFTITEIVIGIAMSIEIYSIYENLRVINPNSKFLGVFAKIIPMIKEFLFTKLTSIFKK